MKKTKLFGLALVATMANFSACSNDAEEVLAQESEIRLTSEITPSRVTSDLQSTQITEGQKIGVTITGSKSGNDYANKLWTSDGEGGLTTTHTVYWANDNITVTAYHPFNEGWTSGTKTFTVSADQSDAEDYLNSDLLFATTSGEVEDKENAISLTFSHKLAKINVTLQPEYQEMDLSSAVISICNTKTSTSINLSDGTVPTEATGEIQEIIAGTGTTASSIVAPQTIAAGTKFIKVVLDTKTFYYTLPDDKRLKSGYSHNYTLTVKETALEIVNSSVISNWTPDEGTIGDANEEVAETKFITLTNAGTLSSFISDEEKYNITSLIITGPINSTDFAFLHSIIPLYGFNDDARKGKLTNLNLSNASIEEGGEPGFTGHYTKNNTLTGNMFSGFNLKTFICSNSVTTLESYCFHETGIISLTISNSVINIQDEFVTFSPNLISIIVEEENTKYDSRDNCNAIIETSSNKLITGCEGTIIPNSVTNIGIGSFSGNRLSPITIPNSVTEINDYAFSDCSNLKTIICEATEPPTLGQGVFLGCNLENVYVPLNSVDAYKAATGWQDLNIQPIEE